MIYGWWISNEVTRPIEKVSLIAKSIERGVSTSLPKTSGSTETDDLLHTLHRNQQQLLNLIGLMDKVSSGDLDVALAPLQQSDRLSTAFQKLLAKVSESIYAKQDLDRVNSAIKGITEEIARIKNGNFDIELTTEFTATNEISNTIKFLIQSLNNLVQEVKNESKQTLTSAKETQKTIQNVIGADENRIREMKQATRALNQIPHLVRNISDELLTSTQAAKIASERASDGSQTACANIVAVNALRGQIRETVKRVGRLGERTQEIGKAAKTVEDLAQRTNLIALNASINSSDSGSSERRLETFTGEVERLATRAAQTNKQISALNKTVAAEIAEIEDSLQDSVGAAANLSRYAIETENSLNNLEKYINQFLNLQENLIVSSTARTTDTESAFESFVSSIAEAENAVFKLKESETQIAQIGISMENLQFAITDFKTVPSAVQEILPANDYSTIFEPEIQP